MIFSTHNLNCLNFLFLMTIRLFLNLPLNLILQKTTKPNLPQSFPNIPLQHSLTTFPYTTYTMCTSCPLYSHTQYSLSIYNLCTHTYTPFVHTLDFKVTHTTHNQLFSTHTCQLTKISISNPIQSLTQSLFLTHINSHTTHLPFISSHGNKFEIQHIGSLWSPPSISNKHISTSIFPTCQIVWNSKEAPFNPSHPIQTNSSQPSILLQHHISYTTMISTIQFKQTHLNHPSNLLSIPSHVFNLNHPFQTKPSQPSISFFPPKQRNIPLEYPISNLTMVNP